jgi:hypothetical protein
MRPGISRFRVRRFAPPRNDSLNQQPGDLAERNLPLRKQNRGGFAFPIASAGLKRILYAQAMFEDKPCIQRPAGVGLGPGGFPHHQDGAADVIERARHLPRALFQRGLGRDALGENQRPVQRKAQAIPESRRNERGFIKQFCEYGPQGPVGAALADCAGDDIERVDVAGAFPSRISRACTHSSM